MTTLTYNGDSVKLTAESIEALPNYKHKCQGEYCASCPHCGGTDRFQFWPDKGNYWCRRCELKGFVVDGNEAESLFKLTPEAAASLKAEIERHRRERERLEEEKRLSAIELLQKRRMDVIYKSNLTDDFLGFIQAAWGIKNPMAFNLGYCNLCPTYHESDSITIPYYWKGELINLRHRLIHPNGSGKYRPEMSGLSAAIFNADILRSTNEYVVLVEGEFKAIVLSEYGFKAVAIPGANGFKEKWTGFFSNSGTVYVALDPGAEAQAWDIAVMLTRHGHAARVVSIPVKPDDFFTLYGGNVESFRKYLRMGRRC